MTWFGKRLVISFSGGRTSAYMAWRLVALCRLLDTPFVVLFANTGEEHEETLRFVDRCDKTFNWGVVWLEAVVDLRPRKGTTFRIVNFETASRRGEPFEAVLGKYGIPNKNYPHCTRELKMRPIKAYVRSLGWKRGTFVTAVGIRADEIDRQRPDAEAAGLIYPLIEWGVTKAVVLLHWWAQAFDLYLPEHKGNCKWCWKKSDRKLFTLALESPEVFDFPHRTEEPYAHCGAGEGPRRYFRKNRSVNDLIAEALHGDFQPFVDGNEAFDPELDEPGGCGETCEIDWAA